MDLQALSSGTPNTKGWLSVVAGALTTNILTAVNFVVQSISARYLTLVSQVSVPNPAVGSQTLFVDSGSMTLSTQDSLGNTVPYLKTTGGTMTGVLNVSEAGLFANPNFTVNGGAGGGSSSSIYMGFFGTSGNGANQIALGSQHSLDNSQYVVAIGDAITSTNRVQVNLGGGDTGNTNGQTRSVCIGNDITIVGGAGDSGVCLGDGAGIGAGSNIISIGTGAVNNLSESFLFGSANIVQFYPNNNGLCDLGTVGSNFNRLFLKNNAVASSVFYSMYGPVTLTSSTTETVLTRGTFSGTSIIPAGATLGTIYRFRASATYSGSITGVLTLRVNTNGVPLVAQAFGDVALTTQGITISGEIVVIAGGNASCMLQTIINGEPDATITTTAAAYNPAVTNNLSITGQWNEVSASDVITFNHFYIESLYAQ